MKVLVDTCVWSKVLRSDRPDPVLSKGLRELVLDNRIVLTGPIIQEILSGVKGKKEFEQLAKYFLVFDSLPITNDVYVLAAEYYNLCKSHGLNGGHLDFLICAVAVHHECALLTTDSDFKMFGKYLPIKLFSL